jgi:hypothetical protein
VPVRSGRDRQHRDEDLIYLLDRMGVGHGVDLVRTSATAQWVGKILGTTVPGLLSRAGPFPAPA